MTARRIDRDQLTEALERWEHWTPDLPGAQGVGRDFDVVLTAARMVRDFPTDEMVEAAGDYIGNHDDARAMLDEVRQVMYGEDSSKIGPGYWQEGGYEPD